MTTNKKILHLKIRNIKLVSVSDPDYQIFISDLKQGFFHLRPSNERTYADLISQPLENTVREWVKKSVTTLEERIVRYEVLNNRNKYEKRFNEIDLIYHSNDKYFLGEIKVSSKDNVINKASNQLIHSNQLLRRIGYKNELLIIQINLNYKNIETEFTEFNEDFSKIEYIEIGESDLSVKYVHLKPMEIFEWGVKNEIISNAELLQNAIEEANHKHLNRTLKKELKQKGIPKDEWQDDLRDL